ncbi:MAG TPA: YceI family protein, partial [Nevskiaceae bacterium]|nr:YceI family protein [Nevskiaceae bacterium]
PAKSMVRLYVFRAGAAGQKAGHNHVFGVPKFEGKVFVPDGAPTNARFDLRVRLEDLVVDDPAWRAQTGDTFAGARSAEDIAGTLKNMLGPKGLDAAQFPDVRLTSVSVQGDWPILVADVAVTLHGRTRTQPVMLVVRRAPDHVEAAGTMVLRQSDFGVEPFAVLGGLLAVQDAVAIRFALVGAPAPAASSSSTGDSR